MNAGSKGSKINVAQISACVGQQSVNGKRIAYSGAGRTLSHYSRYTCDPVGRGFVANNYLNGLRPAEFFMHAAGGRVGLIDTAVKTSEVGQVSAATPVFWRPSSTLTIPSLPFDANTITQVSRAPAGQAHGEHQGRERRHRP